ncbi:MAG TPA: HYR domain-containing protein [Thermoanaerobaculia bacterium]
MQIQARAVLVGFLCLFALTAAADITRVSPSEFDLGTEDFINIYGSNLIGTVETQVVFDGVHPVEPSFAGSDHLIVFVPTPVMGEAGEHTLVVRSIDDGGGVRTHGPVSFTVRAPQNEGGPPLLALPEIVVGEAMSPSGGIVTYEAFAYDANGEVPITCTPASGDTFRLGVTIVSCSATNSFGTTVGSFHAIVTDTMPPVVTVPANISSDTPVVTFTASATDNLDGALPVTCFPASGSTFAQGTTRVRCTATDAHANRGEASFNVTVTGGPPALILPDDLVEEATGPDGAVASFIVTSADDTPVSCTPASGSTFPLGSTTVTCTATNASGTSSGSFSVLVVDTTPPVITAPSLLEVEATSAAGALATYVVTAHDLVDGDVPVSCLPVSGSQFPLGPTDVVCSAIDSRFNGDVIAFQVIVQDTTAPAVTHISATPGTIWPPNHQMVNVTVSATLSDAVDPAPTWKILSVSSNQPTQGTGDGDTPNDWVITGPNTLQLRSERSSGKERVYTITIETKDAVGNTGTATVVVRVADSKKRAAAH